MTQDELNEIKLRLNIGAQDTERDGLISLFYKDAKGFILSYTNRAEEQWSACLSIFSFGDGDLPASLVRTLNQYGLARVL